MNILLLFIYLLGAPASAFLTAHNRQSSAMVKVTRVIDGDTFVAEDAQKNTFKVRLIGIDAPESRNTGRKPVGYFGREAKIYLTKLIQGRNVRLEYDVTRFDRYRRVLAYAYLPDGTFINAHLVRNGFATVLTIPPNVRHADLFVRLQNEARLNRRGLWR
jgi:micrococcal nuclease